MSYEMNGNFLIFRMFKDFLCRVNSLIFCQNRMQVFGHVRCARLRACAVPACYLPRKGSRSWPSRRGAPPKTAPHHAALAEWLGIGTDSTPWPWPHTVMTPSEMRVSQAPPSRQTELCSSVPARSLGPLAVGTTAARSGTTGWILCFPRGQQRNCVWSTHSSGSQEAPPGVLPTRQTRPKAHLFHEGFLGPCGPAVGLPACTLLTGSTGP